MKLVVVSEPPRVSSCISLILSQASSLKMNGHDVSVLIQKRNFDRVADFYGTELMQVQTRLLSSVPIFSKLASRSWATWVRSGGHTYDWISTIDIVSALSYGLSSNLWVRWLEPDAVICHTTYSPLSILSWYYSNSKTKRVLYLHDRPLSYFFGRPKDSQRKTSRLIRAYEKMVLAKSHRIICLTHSLSKAWKEAFNVDAEVAFPGCSPSPEYSDDRKNFILSVWRWEEDTRPFFLIDLMKAIKDTRLNLVMVGSWRDDLTRKRFEEEILQSGLSERVSVLSNIPWQQLVALYRTARCFVYPTWNSFGYAGLEAASQGTPLLAPKGSGLWDMFSSGQDGFSPNEGDVNGYVEAIRALEDDKISKRIGNNIWKHSRLYDWSNHARRIEDILRS